MISIKGRIHGRVQGVFFRKYAKDKALDLNIKGFVRNEPNGTVYFEAEGEEENVDDFKNWCRKGSPGSKVTNVETEENEIRNFKDFQIRY